MADLGWNEAIEQTLRKAGGVMHYADIAEQIVRDGLRKKVGATPAATVSARISQSLKTQGASSPFLRLGSGEVILRELKDTASPPVVTRQDETVTPTEPETVGGIIQAFGMFWERNSVLWTTPNPAILGRQQLGADAVNFSGQKGIYLLYDGRDVVYVGRSVERPLGRRLYEHTQDRLRGRWNRFSWFGLLQVTESGELTEMERSADLGTWVSTMEALLIEGLEPPQNRKRGDDFSAIEYLQAEDPAIERREKMELLAEMQKRFGEK